jgi:hypothetical protein
MDMLNVRRIVSAIGLAAVVAVSTPAQAGWIIYYYSDFPRPGGTVIGWDQRCTDGSQHSTWGDLTGMPDVEYWIDNGC